MGSQKGTHFGISLTLSDTISTPAERVSIASEYQGTYASDLAEDATIVQRRFTFSFQNVSVASSGSSTSGDSSASSSESASTSVTASSSIVASSVSTEGSASEGTASSSEEETSTEDTGTTNMDISADGLWSYYDEMPATSSSIQTSSATDGRALRLEFTSFRQNNVQATSDTPAGYDFFFPARFTKAIFDVTLKGKMAVIQIPVSSQDLLLKVLAVLGGGDVSELDDIHQVKLELTKQD